MNLLLSLCWILVLPYSRSAYTDDQNILRHLVGPKSKYDARIRAPPDKKGPTNVGITLHILHIRFSTLNMEWTAQMYLRQTWNDPRLVFDPDKFGNVSSLTFRDKDKIWLPDLLISNERNIHLHDALQPNYMVRITADGGVLFSSRISVTFPCPMNFQYYPFDRQTCKMEFESFGYNKDSVTLYWYGGGWKSTVIDPVVSDVEMRILRFESKDLTIQTSTGNYSLLNLEILLQRYFGSYISTFYIPTGILMIIPWISLWLTNTSDRVFMCLACLGLLLFKFGKAMGETPKVLYVKAIDIWAGVCFLLVLITLLEIVIVDHKRKCENQKRQKKKIDQLNVEKESESLDQEFGFSTTGESGDPKEGKFKKFLRRIRAFFPIVLSDWIDFVFRIAYPITFGCFIKVYLYLILNM